MSLFVPQSVSRLFQDRLPSFVRGVEERLSGISDPQTLIASPPYSPTTASQQDPTSHIDDCVTVKLGPEGLETSHFHQSQTRRRFRL